MSLGPIREISAGQKRGGVSTFTQRRRIQAKKEEREREQSKKDIILMLGINPTLVRNLK